MNALHKKLLEEAREVTEATNRAEVIAELADVLEVIDALKKALAIAQHEIITVKKHKRQTRGGFKKGVFLRTITMDADNPRVNHFRANPDRYHEQ